MKMSACVVHSPRLSWCALFLAILLCGIARAQTPPGAPLPHFSRDGQILHHYTPGRSIFIRTLFKLDPTILPETPGLTEKLKEAGINTLSTGFFPNPADNGQTTFQKWSQDFSSLWKHKLNIAQRADMSLLLIGDDIARFPRELHAVLTLPWGPHALRTALATVRDSHRVTCIEMVDEVSALWGDTPQPTDDRWLKERPPIPDNAFTDLMKIINSVPNRPPVTWPVVCWSKPAAAAAWMGNPTFSDYATHYWDAGPNSTLAQCAASMVSTVHQRQPVLPADRPFLMLTSVIGPYYAKQGAGGQYTPRQDKLLSHPATPAQVASQILRAAALGAAGVRVYAFDSLWAQERRKAAIGQSLQTGSNPITGIGLARWRAMAAAFHLIEKIEPILLDRQLSAPDWGDNFTTAARQGTTGRIFIAVSNADKTLSHPVDLIPYLYPGGKIHQFHLQGEHLAEQDLSAPPPPASFTPGAAYVWLLTP